MVEEKKEIKVNFPEKLLGGVYANNIMITHTKEEFIMDFLMVTPPFGSVNSRVIISPGHMKRTITALKGNLGKYEEKFGSISPAEAPRPIGFRPPK